MSEYGIKYTEETFSRYREVDFSEMKEFNILHLYNTKKDCYPNGFHDSKWFEVLCFNTNNKTKSKLVRQQDALNLRNAEIQTVRYFVDNSLCITFSGLHKFNGIFQASDIVKITDLTK